MAVRKPPRRKRLKKKTRLLSLKLLQQKRTIAYQNQGNTTATYHCENSTTLEQQQQKQSVQSSRRSFPSNSNMSCVSSSSSPWASSLGLLSSSEFKTTSPSSSSSLPPLHYSLNSNNSRRQSALSVAAGVSSSILNRPYTTSLADSSRRASKVRSIAATGNDWLYQYDDKDSFMSSINTGDGTLPHVCRHNNNSNSVCDNSEHRSSHMSHSSVLWMHGLYETTKFTNSKLSLPQEQQQQQVFNNGGGRDSHMGTNGLNNKFMYYSRYTGALFGTTLVDIQYNGTTIDALIDQVMEANGTSSQTRVNLGGIAQQCFWLDVSDVSAQEIHRIGNVFDLHPLTIEDIIYGCPRDKVDTFDSYMFVAYSITTTAANINGNAPYGRFSSFSSIFADQDDKPNGFNTLYIVIKHECILTFHNGNVRSQVVCKVLDRLTSICSAATTATTATNISMQKDDTMHLLMGLADYTSYILYAILDEATDRLSPELIEIERQVNAVDESVLVLSHDEYQHALKQMGGLRRRILNTWQLTHPKLEIIETLVRLLSAFTSDHKNKDDHRASWLAREVSQYLADIHGHLLAAISTCSRSEAILARSHSNYLAKISLELSRAAYDSNTTTERWTMLGTIVVPINIVTSFLGVNLKVPGQDRDDTLNFFIVLACLLIYSAVTLGFWRWRQIT